MEQTRGLFCTCDSGVAFLAKEFDVRSVLHEQESLVAVIYIYVIH